MANQLNILLVVIDGARADHVSSYGHCRETTPFLDEVAREGVRFSRMFTTSPWTLAAHATLFTGLYAVTHGATEESRALTGRQRLLAEHLKAAGYRTAAFCTNPWVSPDTGFGPGFDAFYTQRRSSRFATRAVHYGRRASDRLLRRADAGARRTNEAFVEWLGSGKEPFFAFLHYNEARIPLRPAHPKDRMFLEPSTIPGRLRALNQDAYKLLAGQVRMQEEDYALLQALYDDALHYVDGRVREVAEALCQRDEWDRTLLIVTADHGENLGEHGMIGHDFGLYDTELHVPLLLRCPDLVPQGFVAHELAQLTDVAPTIVSLLGLSADAAKAHGRPLLERGRATQGPPFIVAERFRPNLSMVRQHHPDLDVRPLDVRSKTIRTARQKFVWHSDEANELYDLIADPAECRNLLEEDATRGDDLRRQLFDWLATIDKYESAATTAERRAAVPLQHASTVE